MIRTSLPIGMKKKYFDINIFKKSYLKQNIFLKIPQNHIEKFDRMKEDTTAYSACIISDEFFFLIPVCLSV